MLLSLSPSTPNSRALLLLFLHPPLKTSFQITSRAMHSLMLLLPLALTLISASSDLILEEGYVVSTVVDFNKLSSSAAGAGVNPFSLLPRPRSQDLLLLDSSGSAFYSLPLPLSQDKEGEIRKFSGKGVSGFSDGDPAVAMFDRPRSFAIDAVDNVYVADRNNHAIRKISKSGVTTTIAGGYLGRTGKVDGPAQNASFSSDFELVYVPKSCALLITDRGNRLIRQVDLKPKDCTQESRSGLGVTFVSAIAIMCAIFGLVIGFIARPFLTFHEVYNNHCVSKTWKHYQTNLGRVVLMTFFGVKSGVANSTLYAILFKLVKSSLGYLSVVFSSVRLGRHVWCKGTVSLLDSDVKTHVNYILKSNLFLLIS
ncbi:uncharacterized protein [Typha latifolia]|uniref:uncharacterized protein isoform X1 n=1 Tax=Typha latifolia TaxID=4733 RepID=UPI003C2D473A